MQRKTSEDIYDARRWGLPAAAIGGLGDRLSHQWEQYRGCFKTRTRDSAKHAWTYLRGLLGMQMKRNYANIARQVIDPEEDGQNLQQFMSDSP